MIPILGKCSSTNANDMGQRTVTSTKNNLKMFAFTTDSISAISLSLQTPRCFINVSFNKKKSSSRVKTRQ